MDIVYLSVQGAFNRAIASGRLSRNPIADNYADGYMYMGTWDGVDQFKNTVTRQYLPARPYTPADRLAAGTPCILAATTQPRNRLQLYVDREQPDQQDYDDTNGL